MGEEHQTPHLVLEGAEGGEEEPQEGGAGQFHHRPAAVPTSPAARPLQRADRINNTAMTPTCTGPALLLGSGGPPLLAFCLSGHDAQLLLQLCIQTDTQTEVMHATEPQSISTHYILLFSAKRAPSCKDATSSILLSICSKAGGTPPQ